MTPALRCASLAAAFLSISACAQIEGLGSIERVACLDDCGVDAGAVDAAPTPTSDGAPATADGMPDRAVDAAADAAMESGVDGALPPADTGPPPADGPSEDAPATVASWAYHRAIALSSDASSARSNEPVLVIVPATFDATHAKANGDDLRFSTSAQHSDDLTYYIESWTPGAPSYVWVRVPNVPVGASTLHVFYGNPSAAPVSSFAATFPNAQRTAGGGAGSFVATGDIAVDWFELRAGDTLLLPQGALLHISARRVILAGLVGGNGRGSGGGPVPDTAGNGPGGGGVSNPVDTESSGGGGNAGAGGHGGEHTAGHGGAGGAPTGTATGDDVAMGSGGGATNANAGGAGGGAVSVLGWRTTVLDLVRVDGLPSVGGADRNGGGGAGGGILIAGYSVELAGATLSALGGSGGDCLQSTGGGGGGGSGGRIKVKHRPNGSLTPAAAMNVTGGAGGTCSGTTAPGAAGATGTTSVDAASTLVTGIEATLGPEQTL